MRAIEHLPMHSMGTCDAERLYCGFLMPFLTEVHMPLAGVRNQKPQREDLPDELRISAVPNEPSSDSEL